MTSLAEAASSWRDWLARGEIAEGAARVQEALDAPGAEAASVERVRVLYAAHIFAFRLGRPSREAAQQTLELARALGDVRGECDGLTGLARAALRATDYEEVIRFAEEGVRKAQDAGDEGAAVAPLHLHAAGVRLSGDYDRARDLYLQSLALAEHLGDTRMMGIEFHNLGWVELHRGDLDRAARMFADRDARSGVDAYSDAWRELNAAALAFVRGSREHALALLESGRRKLDELGVALDPDDQAEMDWLIGQAAVG